MDTWGTTLERWTQVFEESDLSVAGIEKHYGLSAQSVSAWLFRGVIPRKTSIQKMEAVLTGLMKRKSIPYSPVWGYAKPEQIERLRASISEYERSQILKQIEKQTKLKGKVG